MNQMKMLDGKFSVAGRQKVPPPEASQKNDKELQICATTVSLSDANLYTLTSLTAHEGEILN